MLNKLQLSINKLWLQPSICHSIQAGIENQIIDGLSDLDHSLHLAFSRQALSFLFHIILARPVGVGSQLTLDPQRFLFLLTWEFTWDTVVICLYFISFLLFPHFVLLSLMML